MRKLRHFRGSSGQALVRLLNSLPFLLFIVLNAVNFAYFFLMAVNITGASRSSGIYSVMEMQPLPRQQYRKQVRPVQPARLPLPRRRLAT